MLNEKKVKFTYLGMESFTEIEKIKQLHFGVKTLLKIEPNLNNLLLITLKDSSKIYKIDNEFDFMSCPFRKMTEEEKEVYFNLCGGPIIDFEKLSENYDALWITEKAINENFNWICSNNKYNYIGPLFGWDVETVLLFNLDCIEKIC